MKIEEVKENSGEKKKKKDNKDLQNHHEENVSLKGWYSFCRLFCHTSGFIRCEITKKKDQTTDELLLKTFFRNCITFVSETGLREKNLKSGIV